MRGEHGLRGARHHGPEGPSPRARGARPRPRRVPGRRGIIPACAGSTRPAARGRGRPRDHPRVRGEHDSRNTSPAAYQGPSPRARGAPRLYPRAGPVPGTIPACAGSTKLNQYLRDAIRDHPRVRGEHTIRHPATSTNVGPSPRARGARGGHGAGGGRRGTIPACAGSTGVRCSVRLWTGDHPRVRGEHSSPALAKHADWGPSPRARGALKKIEDEGHRIGTISACAGSTEPARTLIASHWDHPRVRGEHHGHAAPPGTRGGPSPRARGARPSHPEGGPVSGTIPACAGSTSSWSSGSAWPRDHPRVRGEHSASPASSPSSVGPSPRARGAPKKKSVSTPVTGTIPACAGSTAASARPRCVPGDHPRVRGEHRGHRSSMHPPKGPSPRARGARRPGLRVRRRGGTIPACAGSTPRARTVGTGSGDHPRVRGEHWMPRTGPSRASGPSPRARGAPCSTWAFIVGRCGFRALS